MSLGTADFRSRPRPFTSAKEPISICSCSLEGREVVVEDEEEGRSVRERVDIDDLGGCEVLSEASSKLS